MPSLGYIVFANWPAATPVHEAPLVLQDAFSGSSSRLSWEVLSGRTVGKRARGKRPLDAQTGETSHFVSDGIAMLLVEVGPYNGSFDHVSWPTPCKNGQSAAAYITSDALPAWLWSETDASAATLVRANAGSVLRAALHCLQSIVVTTQKDGTRKICRRASSQLQSILSNM